MARECFPSNQLLEAIILKLGDFNLIDQVLGLYEALIKRDFPCIYLYNMIFAVISQKAVDLAENTQIASHYREKAFEIIKTLEESEENRKQKQAKHPEKYYQVNQKILKKRVFLEASTYNHLFKIIAAQKPFVDDTHYLKVKCIFANVLASNMADIYLINTMLNVIANRENPSIEEAMDVFSEAKKKDAEAKSNPTQNNRSKKHFHFIDCFTYSTLFLIFSRTSEHFNLDNLLNLFNEAKNQEKQRSVTRPVRFIDANVYAQISAAIVNSEVPDAFEKCNTLLEEAKSIYLLSSQLYVSALSALAASNNPDIKIALKLLSEAVRYKVAHLRVYNATLYVMAKSKNPDILKMYEFFQNTIRGLINKFGWINKDRDGVIATYKILIFAIQNSKNPDVKGVFQLYEETQKAGLHDAKIYSALLDIMNKSGQPDDKRFFLVFEEAKKNHCAHIETYNTVLTHIAGDETPDFEVALDLFNEIESVGLIPTYLTYSAILSVLANSKHLYDDKYGHQFAWTLLQKAEKNTQMSIDIDVYNIMLTILGRSKNSTIEEILSLFNKLKEKGLADTITYNSILDAIAKKKPDSNLALTLLEDAIEKKLANIITYRTAFYVVCQEKNFDKLSFEQKAERLRFKRDNKKIDEIFSYTVTYNITLDAMAHLDSLLDVPQALNLFNEAKEKGYADSITYHAVLDVINRSQKLDERAKGIAILHEAEQLGIISLPALRESMTVDFHDLPPSPGSACLLLEDILGRWFMGAISCDLHKIHFRLIHGKGLHSEVVGVSPVKNAIQKFLKSDVLKSHILYCHTSPGAGDTVVGLQRKGLLFSSVRDQNKCNQKQTAITNTPPPSSSYLQGNNAWTAPRTGALANTGIQKKPGKDRVSEENKQYPQPFFQQGELNPNAKEFIPGATIIQKTMLQSTKF